MVDEMEIQDSDRGGQRKKRSEIEAVISQIDLAQQAVNKVYQRATDQEEVKESSSYTNVHQSGVG